MDVNHLQENIKHTCGSSELSTKMTAVKMTTLLLQVEPCFSYMLISWSIQCSERGAKPKQKRSKTTDAYEDLYPMYGEKKKCYNENSNLKAQTTQKKNSLHKYNIQDVCLRFHRQTTSLPDVRWSSRWVIWFALCDWWALAFISSPNSLTPAVPHRPRASGKHPIDETTWKQQQPSAF